MPSCTERRSIYAHKNAITIKTIFNFFINFILSALFFPIKKEILIFQRISFW